MKKTRLSIIAILMVLLISITGCININIPSKGEPGVKGSDGGKTVYADVPTKVVEFDYEWSSDVPPIEFVVKKTDDGVTFAADYANLNPEDEYPVDESILDALSEWVDEYDIKKWDGFDKTRSNVFDGSAFRLSITLETGETITAHGNNVSPENYGKARPALMEILEGLAEDIINNENPDAAPGEASLNPDDYLSPSAKLFSESTFDEMATAPWQSAYKELLESFEVDLDALSEDDEYPAFMMRDYSLYDIDKDGIPELLIKQGTCEADYTTEFYYWDGKNVKNAGMLYSGHTEYYTYPEGNGLVHEQAHMGYQIVTLITFDGKNVDEGENLLELDLNETMEIFSSDDYAEISSVVPGAMNIPLYDTKNHMPLLRGDGPIKTCSEPLPEGVFETMIDRILDCEQNFYGVAMGYRYSASDILNSEMSMLGLYEKDGLFTGTDGETVLKEKYFVDLNEDGQDECLAVFEETQNKSVAIILFSYQDEYVYGYISNPMYKTTLELMGGKLYSSDNYSNSRIDINFCFDLCDVEYLYGDHVVWSEQAKADLDELRQELSSENAYMGVAFLGCSGDYSGKYVDEVLSESAKTYSDMAFMSELEKCKMIREPGEEVYIIVPAKADYIITVYEQIWGEATKDGMPERGKLLYEAEPGTVVLVRGNQSDIVSNIEIVMDAGGEEVIYHPSLSLENGEVSVTDGVKDFSRY